MTTELVCEKCGKRADPTASGAVFCDGCRGWVYRCSQCENMTLFGQADPHLDEAIWLCARCETQNRLADVPEEDKTAIRTAARSEFLAGVKEARNRLGWSLNQSVEAVHALCDQIEANYPTPELQAKLEDFRRFLAEKFAQQAGRHPPGSIR
jgi:phage FluMu protein Com